MVLPISNDYEWIILGIILDWDYIRDNKRICHSFWCFNGALVDFKWNIKYNLGFNSNKNAY